MDEHPMTGPDEQPVLRGVRPEEDISRSRQPELPQARVSTARTRKYDSMARGDKTQQEHREATASAKSSGERHPGVTTAERGFRGAATFGPFRLRAPERILEKDGVPLKIGSRALDLLVTLVEHAPQVVTKRELMARAWGRLVVNEGSLRFHIAALRKVLGDGESGARYITNVPGRGYCCATPVTFVAPPSTRNDVAAPPSSTLRRLPRRPTRVLGRDEVVRDLARKLREQRFVSIVGPGGIGKTTVALAVAYDVLAEFAGAVHFLDLAALADPQLIAGALASQLGLSVASENPVPAILGFLRERRVLLVLDSCEHLIETVATLAEVLFCDAPQVYLLVTSREALRAEGEWVHHLPPLECPPRDAVLLTATQALGFPAVQLFVEQVEASGYPLRLSDADAPIVADLCRRLDGIALALELASRCVARYGIKGTASLLDSQFNLLHGRRTATPRHQTMTATLDWSHGLLSEAERLLLRRLAIFVGTFSLEAAVTIVADELDAAAAAEMLARLVEKSLVSLEVGTAGRYRLLDTTRAYAALKLTMSGERKAVARRHAEYVTSTLERFGWRAWKLCTADGIDFFTSELGNVRAALEWSFGSDDADVGVRLAAAAAPFFLQLSLLPECIVWCERAMSRLDPISAAPLELELQTCFALALLSVSNSPKADSALLRALLLAQSLQDRVSQLLVMTAIYRHRLRSGDWRELSDLTARCEAVAREIPDPLANAIVHSFAAVTSERLGEHTEAAEQARMACGYPVHASGLNGAAFSHAIPAGPRSVLARTLWMLGYPDQAVKVARLAVNEAAELDHPATMTFVLVWSVLVFLRTGDWQTARELIQRIVQEATTYAFTTYHPIAIGWQGVLAIRTGEPLRGTALLRTALARLRVDGYEAHHRVLSAELTEGFLRAGETRLAHTAIYEAIEWADARGPSCEAPELLRLKGEVLISMAQGLESEGERSLLESLQLAHDRQALSLELRTGMSLARHWAATARGDRALQLLTSIYSRFTEGFHTIDLVSARSLLDELRSPTQSSA
jgi:predicted ATPase/DNA-binding winged helix-turn-helix (wHTH) protein